MIVVKPAFITFNKLKKVIWFGRVEPIKADSWAKAKIYDSNGDIEKRKGCRNFEYRV